MAILVLYIQKTAIFLFFMYGSISVEARTTTQIISSCDKTPHPQVCHEFITTYQTQLPFGDLALKVTKDQAREAHRLILSMSTSLINGRAKSAWRDCLELYKDTNELLDQAINSKNSLTNSSTTTSSMDDIQTYLSASIANQEACKDGFLDHNSSTPHLETLSLMLTNFTKLLSNALAIHSFSPPPASHVTHNKHVMNEGFPLWVSHKDRRLLEQPKEDPRVDLVVDKNGLGHYNTISEALLASTKLRKGNIRRFVIHVKAGVYTENIEITKKMKNLMLIGDGIDITIIRGNKNVVDGCTTFRSATFAVSGDSFIARDITFENTAGPKKHQAVALRSGSDFSVFYKCSFKGYQDTLYVHSKRQFYRNCDIYGTIDLIFGDAAVVLQGCNIYMRRPIYKQKVTITAQGRSNPHENTGIVIHRSRIMAAKELKRVSRSLRIDTYLGRPWKKYSRTVFIKCFLNNLINPQGWLPWNGAFALKTLYYGEYMNFGPGASTRGRVNWTGYHVITNPIEALRFTAENFLAGDLWIPVTGAPYMAGL